MKSNQTTRNPITAHVVSVSKDTKTAKVEIPRIVANERYGKRLHLQTTLLADAREVLNLNAGDIVKVSPCKKISKRKAWRVVSLVTSSK